jgi:siderophore synthetase component
MISWATCLLLNSGLTVFFAILYALSEYIGRNPNIKENTLYQFVHHFLVAATKNHKQKEK